MSPAEKRVLTISKHVSELNNRVRFVLTDSEGLRPPTRIVRALVLLSKGDRILARYLDAGVGALILTDVRALD